MTEKKKPTKKVWVFAIGGATLFAVLIILVTCSLFDGNIKVETIDYRQIVKNSAWSFNQKNADESKLIPALRNVVKIKFAEDLSMNILYSDDHGVGSYSLACGKVDFDSSFNGTVCVKQATEDGYISNNLSVHFSNKDDSFVMTVDVQGSGTLYFFLDD